MLQRQEPAQWKAPEEREEFGSGMGFGCTGHTAAPQWDMSQSLH